MPTERAIAAQHPLPAPGVRLTGGLLHAWQRRNAAASMPLALHQLVAAGNLANLQLAIRAADAETAAQEAMAQEAGGPPPANPAATATRKSGSVVPLAGLGYHGPVFMDSDIYKTLEAIGWELESARAGQAPGGQETETARDQALNDFAANAIALLARAQRPDGYLNSYIQASGEPRYADLAASHEMYCAGHLIQAAIALCRGAGEQAAMDIAVKLADHLVKEFAGQRKGLDGHPIIETALVELYRETGNAAYRDLAKQFVDQRGHGLAGDSGFGRRYMQDHLEVRQRTSEVGHAVRALYLEAGVTDVAAETGDTRLLDGSARRWQDMIAGKTYLTGGNGSRHDGESFGDHFELPPDRAYNETCAAIASFHWSWRLLLATGDARYADHMERILYNGFAAAINTEGVRFFYVNPLQRRADHYEKDDPGRRREWFKCACCPPNIMRLLASLHHYLATEAGDTLYLHQYATARVAGAGLEIEAETGYPWDGLVTLRVLRAPGEEREIALRVPAWSPAAALTVNAGPAERLRVPPPAYLRVRRAWRAGDEVRLRLDMTPRLTYPDPRVDAIRGCAAIERGPLVYCFEQADQAARLDELALYLDAGVPATVFSGTGLTEREVIRPAIGRTIQVVVPARHTAQGAPGASSAVSQDHTGSHDHEDAPGSEPDREPASQRDLAVSAVAIPYFQWDNRGPGPMRVWMPVASQAPPSPM
jgi:hypothetical protein